MTSSTKRYGFEKMTIDQFEQWINDIANDPKRTIKIVQNHCTESPDYADFKGDNHFELQRGMKNYHVNKKKFSDIGQHFSTFPDGMIVTGRPITRIPSTCRGANAGAIGIEHLGDFDEGRDQMTAAQRETIIRMNAILCKRFGITPSLESMTYHHWYSQSGKRVGSSSYKTCPGTNWFGGNKEADAVANFYPLVVSQMQVVPETTEVVTTTETQINDAIDSVNESVDVNLGKVVFWRDLPKDNFDTSLSFMDRMKALILLLSSFFLAVWVVRGIIFYYQKRVAV